MFDGTYKTWSNEPQIAHGTTATIHQHKFYRRQKKSGWSSTEKHFNMLGLHEREWRRLHNEELSDLYSSPNIVRVIK